ncbi:MAG: class I SAM-dependent methyltransferase [Acidobacteriaceae bacterium]
MVDFAVMDFEAQRSATDEIYSASDYHARMHGVLPGAFEMIARYRGEKFARLLDTAGKDVLEFGCGPGWNLVDLPARRRVGCDVSTAYAESLRASGIEFVSDAALLEGQQFDIVLLSHVAEHLMDPARTVIDLAKFLKPQGTLCVVVPMEGSISKFDPADNNHHLFSWNVQTLTNLLTAAGYRVTSCRVARKGYDRYAANLAVRVHAGYRGYLGLLRTMRLLRPVYEIQARVTRQETPV